MKKTSIIPKIDNENIFNMSEEEKEIYFSKLYEEKEVRAGTFFNAEINDTDIYRIYPDNYIYTDYNGDVLHFDVLLNEELPKYAMQRYEYMFNNKASLLMELIYNNKLNEHLIKFNDEAIKFYQDNKEKLLKNYTGELDQEKKENYIQELLNEQMAEYIKG